MITRLADVVTAITCDGRRVDAAGAAHGPVHGVEFQRLLVKMPLDEQARCAGWAIGPDDTAMCPTCRKPDRTPVDITTYQTPSTEE